MLPPCIYLITGNDPVAPGMVDVLPIPSTRRLLPLRGKDFFGGALSWDGYNRHLVPPHVCALVPSSERRFVWWSDAEYRKRDAASGHMRSMQVHDGRPSVGRRGSVFLVPSLTPCVWQVAGRSSAGAARAMGGKQRGKHDGSIAQVDFRKSVYFIASGSGSFSLRCVDSEAP